MPTLIKAGQQVTNEGRETTASGRFAVDQRVLGNTGTQLPAIALGTWEYRGGVEPLRAGIELGATFIDTAESYGTEEIVGEAIKQCRHQVFLATKMSPRHFRRQDTIRAAEQSLERLRTDYIDLYQLHWPNYRVAIAETMAAMEELVAMGKIRFIGVSNFSSAEIACAQSCLTKNRIVSNQVRYNLVDRTIESGLLPYCQAKEISILAFSPLGNGMNNLLAFDRQDVLGRVAEETGHTRAQVALNWCICRDPVIAIFKADRIEHVRENCGACGWRLAPDQLQALNGVPFRRRGAMERFGRRLARRVLQTFGRNL